MGQGHHIEPVGYKLWGVAHGHRLELDDFSKSCHCIVSCMVKLLQFRLFSLDGRVSLEVNACFKACNAGLINTGEGLSTVLSHHSDTICGCLPNGCKLACTLLADLFDHRGVHGSEIVWTQEFNHVVKDKEHKFGIVLLVTSRKFDQMFTREFLDKTRTQWLVSFK